MRQESLAAARALRACKLCKELQGAAKEFEAVDDRIRLALLLKKKKKILWFQCGEWIREEQGSSQQLRQES